MLTAIMKISTNTIGRERNGQETTLSSHSCPQQIQASIARGISKKNAKHGAKYEQAIKTMKGGTRFIMSNVGFVEDAKLAYVSSSLKIVVDLSST